MIFSEDKINIVWNTLNKPTVQTFARSEPQAFFASMQNRIHRISFLIFLYTVKRMVT